MKRFFFLFFLAALFLMSCAKPAQTPSSPPASPGETPPSAPPGTSPASPPPSPLKSGIQTEFLLAGYKSPADTQGADLEKKKAIYHAIKRLSSKSNIAIIYDASASMKEKIGEKGLRKFEAAYEGLKQIGTLLGPTDHVGLFVFGSKKPFGIATGGILYRKDYIRAIEAAADVELVYSSSQTGFNQEAFISATKFLGSPKAYIGDTPIGYSVLKAHQMIKGLPNAKVILITDGEETGPALAQNVSRDKAWEQRLRRSYPNYDEITISASESIKKLVADNIHFSPILYGPEGPVAGKPAGEKEAQSTREFYRKLATESGSISLEAATPLDLMNAFMDAEMMSLTYGLYSSRQERERKLVVRGKVGVPLMAEAARYLLKTDAEQPFEQQIELKPKVKNVYFFNVGNDGKLRITAAEPGR